MKILQLLRSWVLRLLRARGGYTGSPSATPWSPIAKPEPPTVKLIRPDAHDIARAVYRHCQVIGCDESNKLAAINWALASTGHTLAAIRAGNQRADQLRYRQKNSQPNAPLTA